MNSKIILCGPGNSETLVASFRSSVEAFQCAALLQAITNSDNYVYYVDCHIKGKGMRRIQPDSITSTVFNSPNLLAKLKPCFV